MGSHEFEEWKAEYRREPWDLEATLLAQLVHLMHVKDFKPPHPTIHELLGVKPPPKRQQTQQEMKDALLSWGQIWGAQNKAG